MKQHHFGYLNTQKSKMFYIIPFILCGFFNMSNPIYSRHVFILLKLLLGNIEKYINS